LIAVLVGDGSPGRADRRWGQAVKWAARSLCGLAAIQSRSAERAGAYVAIVRSAASTPFPVAPASASLPAPERVGGRVRGLPGIKRLQRIDDVVIIDDVSPSQKAAARDWIRSHRRRMPTTQVPTAFRRLSCRHPARRPAGDGRPSKGEVGHLCQTVFSWNSPYCAPLQQAGGIEAA
jgi:hypothetical protein